MDILSERSRRIATVTLFLLALAYAFTAGLRTVTDFDVGWIVAMGRFLVGHHQVPKSEFLSYTAYGIPWIYPSFGGALLYLAYAAGGFAALSWINAFACTGVIALSVGRPRLLTCALAIFAVPAIALRTAARAELFTTFFFAAFLAVMRKHRRGGKSCLWALPLMMLLWVNAHPGFAVGIALLGACVALELLDLCVASKRAAATVRLKSTAPWIALTILATLINPWGVKVYQGLVAQNNVGALQNIQVGEWSGVRLTAASLEGIFQLRDPNASYWWLLVFACLVVPVALYRRQFGYAVLLVGAAYLSVGHLRFQALFAIVVVVIAGEVFGPLRWPDVKPQLGAYTYSAATIVLAVLTLFHITDTVSNRWYMADGELSLFGPGLSWWYPRGAAAFIETNALPANLFHDYNSGGYITLRLGPGYRDFADGRAIPFSGEILAEQAALVHSPPDSAAWADAAERRGINTIVLSLARFGGLESVPLRDYCESKKWKPVYLDDVSIVLLSNRPENQHWINRLAIDCANYRIVPSPADPASARGRAELYNFYANTASIYYVLGRDNDVSEAISRAENLFSGDPNLFMLAGQLAQANGKFVEAEAQYRHSLQIRPTDNGWYLLARLFIAQQNYAAAAAAVQHSADLAVLPAERYRLLGNLELAMNKPVDALPAFDRAERFGRRLAPLASYPAFRAKVSEGRARAWLALHDANRAAAFAEESTRLAPEPQRWSLLADCYAALGRPAEAEQARARARFAASSTGEGFGAEHSK